MLKLPREPTLEENESSSSIGTRGSAKLSDSIVFLYQLSNLLPTAVPLTSLIAENKSLLRRCSDFVGEAFVLDNVNASEIPIDDSPRKSTEFKDSIFS